MKLIGFCGQIGAGKTTAAFHLCDKWYYARHRFAQPLKDMMRALGLSDAEIDGADREKPCRLLGGKTPRYAMQVLGTEWGRELIDPEIWTRAWYWRLVGDKIVADDVRFPNEVAMIHELGGTVIEIQRGERQPIEHASEAQLLQTDLILDNNGTKEALYARLDDLVERMNRNEPASLLA